MNFFCPKIVQPLPTILGFSEGMRQTGHLTHSYILCQETIPASPSVARHLQLEKDTPVMRLVRLRIVDNEPLTLETSFISLKRFPELINDDFALRSLYDIFTTRYGIEIIELEQTLEPVLMTDYEAELLENQPGNPAMLIQVTALAGDNDPCEFSKAIVRGDKCQYYFCTRSER